MAEKIVIASLDIDMGALLKSTTELKAEIDRLKEAQKQLTKEGDTASEQYVQNVADLKTLNSAYNANVKAISDSTTAQADQANQSKLVALALNSEAQSIKEAREQNALLNRLRNETNVSTVEGKAQLDALNEKLNQNNNFIKENADQYLQQKINIGNYKDSITEALGELNLFNGGLGGFMERAQASGGAGNLLRDSLGGATSGMMGMVKASLAFIATPVGAILAVLVGAFALIKSAMNRSEDATNKLKVAFSAVTGIVNTVLKALEPLGKFLIDGIVMGFELAGEVAEKAMGLISDGLAFLGFDEASKGVKDFTNEIKAGVKGTQDLAKAEQELENSQRKARLTQLEYQKGAEKLRQIRDDESLSTAERMKANEELGILLKKQMQEELAIAQQALKVANLRIEAEGKTKENIDAQYQAMTEIADIQERITGQESEQLVNRNSLIKEANDKAKELREKNIADAIAKSRQEIDLFIAQQGFKKKSTEEEYNFNKQIYDKELKDLELRYSKGKVSKLEYETEKLNLATEFSKSNADLLIAEGERELEIIKNNAKLSIDARLEAELNYQDLRLEQGIINEQQYQDAITQIQNDYEKMRQDKKLEDEALERERKAIDLENKRANDQLTFEQDVELQREQNAIKLEEELLNAEKSGADQQLIKDKYAQLDQRLTQSVEDFKIASLSNTFGKISALFGQQSKIGKAFALYQAGIDGYQSVMKAFNSQFIAGDPSSLPRAIGAGAFAGAFAVKQIAGIAGAKFEKGGIQEIGGKRHSAGGTKFYGEDGTTFEAEAGEGIGILNRSAFSTFMDFNNRFGSGSSASGFFQGGGIITQGVRTESANLDAVVEAIANIPPPVVAVEEIQSVGNRFVQVQQNANL